jgi:hypothetical protein
VSPVWRLLIQALGETVELTWRGPGTTDRGWFPGEVRIEAPRSPAPTEIVSCSDPHAKVVESLRWVRELLASGSAGPDEIAICATSTEPRDEHFLVLAASAELPIYFSHGVPALSTHEGKLTGNQKDPAISRGEAVTVNLHPPPQFRS